MELQYFGANCVRINTKKATIVVDDNLQKLGLRPVAKITDVCLNTLKGVPAHECKFQADMPGEYEIAGMVIHGIAARAHMDKNGEKTAVIYTVAANDIRIAILGHIHPDLSDDDLEQIGPVDIAVVPVGNSGYTLDGTGALQVIKKMEPKIVIPTHYADKAIKYEVPQIELAEALKGLAMEPSETLDSYKPNRADWTDTAKLIVLNRQ